MKNLIFLLISTLMMNSQVSAQKLSPYIKVGDVSGSMKEVSAKVVSALKSQNFKIVGFYHPAQKANLKIIAFTRSDLKNTVVKVPDRGALAATMKIGLYRKGDKVAVSYTFPEYVLRAYLRDNYAKYQSVFNKFNNDLKLALSSVGSDFTPFGGKVSADKLKKYHYKVFMPYFTDPVTLKTFASFSEGVKTIEQNLSNHVGKTSLIYKIKYKSKNIAVYGVALRSKSDGESVFLPKIGERHIAAMPYQVILQGKKATILPGKYRIALFWPELSMGTFMRIVSTPGDIEDTLALLCQ